MHFIKPASIALGLLTMFAPTKASANATDRPQPQDVTVEVQNIDTVRGGTIMVFLFGKDGFPKQHEKALELQTHKANAERLTFTFRTSAQEVGIKILHDEDGNGKVTKNWTGIYPKEGLGFSNNQKISMTGAPGFKKSKITSADLSNLQEISMRYPGSKKSRGKK